jgi:hypothetical protein
LYHNREYGDNIMRTFLSTLDATMRLKSVWIAPSGILMFAFLVVDDDDWWTCCILVTLAMIVFVLQSEYGQAIENKVIPDIKDWWRGCSIRWIKKGKKEHEEMHRWAMFAAGRWISMRGYAPKSGRIHEGVGQHIEDLLDRFWEAGATRKMLCAMRLGWYITRIGTGRLLWSALHKNRYAQILFGGELNNLTFKGVTAMPNLDLSDFRPGRVKIVMQHPTYALKRGDLQKADEFWCSRINGGRPVTYESAVDLKGEIMPGVWTIRPIPDAPRIIVFEDLMKGRRDPTRMFWGWNLITGQYDWWTLEQWTNSLLMGLPGGGKTVKALQDWLQLNTHPQVTNLYALDVHKRGAGGYDHIGGNKIKVATNFKAACKMMTELRHNLLNWRFEQIEKFRNKSQFTNQQIALLVDEVSAIYKYVPNPPMSLEGKERKAFIEEEEELHDQLVSDLDAWTGLGREAYCHTILIGQKLTGDACLSSTRQNCSHWSMCTALDETTVEGMFGKGRSSMLLDPTRQLPPGHFANRRHTQVEFHQSAITREHAKEKGLI